MPLITFSFAFDTDKKQGSMAGNVGAQTALAILQNLIIASAIENEKAKKINSKKPVKAK